MGAPWMATQLRRETFRTSGGSLLVLMPPPGNQSFINQVSRNEIADEEDINLHGRSEGK